MNNVIDLNKYRAMNRSKKYVAHVMYMYGDNEEGLCGTLTVIENREFASIEALREEIKEQKEALRTGFNRDGSVNCDDELYPWEDCKYLVCNEGAFCWDWDSEDYVFVGELKYPTE